MTRIPRLHSLLRTQRFPPFTLRHPLLLAPRAHSQSRLYSYSSSEQGPKEPEWHPPISDAEKEKQEKILRVYRAFMLAFGITVVLWVWTPRDPREKEKVGRRMVVSKGEGEEEIKVEFK
ncbi:hypothetical protein BT69DRAFT_1356870 [Atractiella rhizophila]|nr:hypothetical protein BT69DRAFT_1356870 [Atractiella rhizophila]